MKVVEYIDASDFLYEEVVCKHLVEQELSYFYDWILENLQQSALDLYVNNKFPNGAERAELTKYFMENWREIAESLGYFRK